MIKKKSTKTNFQSRIIKGDVIKTLKKISIKLKFDVVIADPPYNIGKNFGNNLDKMQIKKYVECCRQSKKTWNSRRFTLV